MRRISTAAGLAYMVLYLIASRDVSLARDTGWAWRLAPDWPSLWLQARAPFRFEGIAMLEAGGLAWIVSPVNLLIAGLLGAVIALNVHGVLALYRCRSTCRTSGAGVGVLASLPALLAGGACCAPALVLLIAMPGLGALAGLFGWLIPVSLMLLVVTRRWQRHHGAPAWSGRPATRASVRGARAWRTRRRKPG